jgi:hypothetical protein
MGGPRPKGPDTVGAAGGVWRAPLDCTQLGVQLAMGVQLPMGVQLHAGRVPMAAGFTWLQGGPGLSGLPQCLAPACVSHGSMQRSVTLQPGFQGVAPLGGLHTLVREDIAREQAAKHTEVHIPAHDKERWKPRVSSIAQQRHHQAGCLLECLDGQRRPPGGLHLCVIACGQQG